MRLLIKKKSIVMLFFIVLTILLLYKVSALPLGAAPIAYTNESAPAGTPGTVKAQAGNVSGLTITGTSVTQSWQGYFGNVSGAIVLSDSNGFDIYNWTLANPQGEVYAANDTVTWTNIQCLNFTASGDYANVTDNPGDVSLNGTNLSQLESFFNINTSAVDGVNETFTLQHGGAGEHDAFYVGSYLFSEGECISTRIHSVNGAQSDQYEEILLYDPANRIPVFASILEFSGLGIGFDGGFHDFEMLVLEDGHNGNTNSIDYYFYVELE